MTDVKNCCECESVIDTQNRLVLVVDAYRNEEPCCERCRVRVYHRAVRDTGHASSALVGRRNSYGDSFMGIYEGSEMLYVDIDGERYDNDRKQECTLVYRWEQGGSGFGYYLIEDRRV